MSSINVALFQTPASFVSKEDMLDKVETMILNNNERKVDLFCFPELFSSNVNLVNLDNTAETENGQTYQRLSKIAKDRKAFIVAGILEKEGCQYYNTALLINDNGEFIGKHRKIALNEFESNYLDKGSEVNTFDTKIGRMGILIGNDLNSLEISNRLAIADVDIIVCLTQAPYEFSCVVENVALARAMDIPTYLLLSSNVGTSNISRLEFKGVTSVLYNNIVDEDLANRKAEDFVISKMDPEQIGILNEIIDIEKYKEHKEYAGNLIMHKEISDTLGSFQKQ